MYVYGAYHLFICVEITTCIKLITELISAQHFTYGNHNVNYLQ